MWLCTLHTWLLLISRALLSRCHMTEQCREQQSVGYIFSWDWWQSEGGAHLWSYITLYLHWVPRALHAFKNNCYHFGPVLVSDQYGILVNHTDSPSSASDTAVAVGVEAKEWGHAVNTAQQHGQQPPLHRHLQSYKTTFTHVWSNLPKVETGWGKIILIWGALFNEVTDPAGLQKKPSERLEAGRGVNSIRVVLGAGHNYCWPRLCFERSWKVW